VSGKTVVLVDDDADVRTLVRGRLRLSRSFVVVAEGGTGGDAVRLAGEHRPDAMLLDVSMPEMDGLDAMEQVREVSPETKIVIYTGVARPGLAARAMALGAAAFLDKATPIDQLADRLTQILAGGPPGAPRLPERRNGTAALRHTEEQFRLLVEGVGDYAIFMLDPNGCIASWNLGAERIKGYSAAEAIGHHFRMFYTLDAQQVRHPEHELEAAIRDGRYEEEGWRVRKDGSLFWANVVITPIRDRRGELVGFGKVTRDITERRDILRERERAAAQLAAANTQLAAANTQLAAANSELAEANTQLAAAAEDKTQFLAVTAHELRTPIRVVTGAADTLAEHWPELTRSERTELLASMRTSGARIRRLLDDLLTTARLESGAVEIHVRPTLVRPLVLDSVAQTLATSPQADIEVACPSDVAVRADPSRLAQILANYLTNATRYGSPPVRVDVATTGGDVVIEVRDHGPGVSPELETRLFEKFAHGSEDRGTGLGLFVVRQLARAQGGDAWYERRPGMSCFAVRLAAAEGPPERP
jgi:PAS domain S-box-containing protein